MLCPKMFIYLVQQELKEPSLDLMKIYKSGDLDRNILYVGIPELDLSRKPGEPNAKTLLHIAAIDGNTRVLSALLKRHDVDIELEDDIGLTAMHCAASVGHLKCVELLAKSGADVNVTSDGNHIPIILAAWNGHWRVVEHLIFLGADLNSRGEICNTALIFNFEPSYRKLSKPYWVQTIYLPPIFLFAT